MPTFDPDSLSERTRARFPDFAGARIEVHPLDQDGSDRSYYRLEIGPSSTKHPELASLLVMRFGTERTENFSFVPLTGFLHSLGVACPEIYAYDETEHLVWLQDLGNRLLSEAPREPWSEGPQSLYQSALREAVRLHQVTEESFARNLAAPREVLQPPFDEKLYCWEQDYFFENFVAHFSDVDDTTAARIRSHPGLSSLTNELASVPRSLVHRDFQSRNIMLVGEGTYLIDYQGMRFGLPEYDLASLLYDPYVDFTDARREQLFKYYQDLIHGAPSLEVTRDRFLKCAASRLMQALGAYGFLGLKKGKRHFLDSIPRAVANLQAVLAQLPELEALAPLLKTKDA